MPERGLRLDAGADDRPGSGHDPLHWVVAAAEAAASKTEAPTVVLDVGEVLAVTGWFVVTSGSNPRAVRTIAEEVEAQLTEAGGPKPLRVEGLDQRRWVLLDYGDFVVHVFGEEEREFYDLERLWSDVDRVDWRSHPA
jgi:ribosome-associated protein